MKKLKRLTLRELSTSAMVMGSVDEQKLLLGGTRPTGWDSLLNQGGGFEDYMEDKYINSPNIPCNSGSNLLPEVNVIVDGPNTTLMSFNDFVNSCKSDYSSTVVSTVVGNIAGGLSKSLSLAFGIADAYDDISSIANNNTNLEIIQNIANTGNAQGDSVNLSVTRTANNVTVYTTAGDSIYSSYGK